MIIMIILCLSIPNTNLMMRRASSTSGATLDYDDDHNVKYVVDESSMMTMVTMVINDNDGDDGYDGDNDDDLRSTGATPPLHQST